MKVGGCSWSTARKITLRSILLHNSLGVSGTCRTGSAWLDSNTERDPLGGCHVKRWELPESLIGPLPTRPQTVAVASLSARQRLFSRRGEGCRVSPCVSLVAFLPLFHSLQCCP